MTAAVLYFQSFHAAGVTKRRNRKIIIFQQDTRLLVKKLPP
ncbi:hypothetical protein LTSEALA_5386 [Salmonella enterica subsp. enterica serovar Alachua str. R6-377]|uniref:Uncharacterized protein n=1 Tax=Salmonella enterica subsp. enterica serovar Alachua str. R6-377 TaxID=913241 RepID=G5LVP5_SALET|nr:hypothetical protein LTSEALA_5386 [Salmonella enterica subsp. enterica serovar Alachua str. R6-377]